MTWKRTRNVAFAAAFLAGAAIALLAAPEAAGGTYRAVQCHAPLGAGHADARFTSSSGRYVSSADCAGRGLAITHEPGAVRTAGGRFGAWTIAAPAGTALIRAAARVSAAGADWHTPQAFVERAQGTRDAVGVVRGGRHAVGWRGSGGRALTARLICSHRPSCGAGRGAFIHLRRVALVLRDTVAPSVAPAGSLLSGGPRRGTQELLVSAGDGGSGVRTVSVELNGELLAIHTPDCRLARGVALRLRPCPASETARFELTTTARAFRQGSNRVRVCAADHGRRARVNRSCAVRRVRIDNLCPVSTSDAAVLDARVRGAGGRRSARSDERPLVTGSLRDAAGAPVAGARICVAARVRGAARERVIATPTTNGRGEFTLRLPAGPSRDVRIAHWPNEDRALQRRLSVDVRAIPRLRLRPKRTLSNGDRLRFLVRIPGPRNAGRRVAVQARGTRGWIPIAAGRTSRTGTWRGRYRFGSTTGTRRYAFRAFVPRQPGYPYRGGRSRVAHARVTGA